MPLVLHGHGHMDQDQMRAAFQRAGRTAIFATISIVGFAVAYFCVLYVITR